MAQAKFIIPLLVFAFLTWIVYLAGVAALQSKCSSAAAGADATGVLGLQGVWGFSPSVLSCSKVYRWSWFIFAFEFVIIVGLLIATAVGRLWHARLAFIGLFSIATLLYMIQSESYLTLTQANGFNDTNTPLGRARTAAAGAIMTVVANVFIVLALGIDTAVLATTTTTGAGYATDKHQHTTTAAPGATTGAHTVPATAV